MRNGTKSGILTNGTPFEQTPDVFPKFTHKDLVLIAGIVVALLVALSVLIFDNPTDKEAIRNFQPGINTSPAKVMVQKIGAGLLRKF